MRLHELADRRRDAVDLLGGELGEHRDREDLARDLLGDREVALAVSQELGRLLEMDRYRVVDLRPDAAFAEVLAQVVAPSAGSAATCWTPWTALTVRGLNAPS